MKKNLRGYYEYTEEELDDIWNDCIFVIDACSILDLYRVSDKTRSAYFDLFKKIKDKLWIPFNIAEEFARNKDYTRNNFENEFEKVVELFKVPKDYENELAALKNRISGKDEEFSTLKNEIKEMYSNIKKSFNSLKDTHFNSYDSSKIEEEILNLFNGKVGEKPDEVKLKEYEKIGEERYNERIPPGYMDQSKNKFHNKYGDLINWLDIIAYAKDNNINIIFVTSEKKEDWFEKSKGEIIRPRAELINEFNNKTKKFIAIYRIESFMNFAKVRLDINSIDDNVLDEINKIDRHKKDMYLSSIDKSIRNEINNDDFYKYNSSLQKLIEDDKYNKLTHSYQNEVNDDEYHKYRHSFLKEVNLNDLEKYYNKNTKTLFELKHSINSNIQRLRQRLEKIRHEINHNTNSESDNLDLEREYYSIIESLENYYKELSSIEDIMQISNDKY